METIRLDHNDHPSGGYNEMPEGLAGYWWETDRQICIPDIRSFNPHRLLRFLGDCEAKGKAVVFPTVINARLDRLLRLRGYVDSVVFVGYMGTDTPCLTKNPEGVALAKAKVRIEVEEKMP